MSFEEKLDIHRFIKPFSFDGWEGQDIVEAKPDFVESHAIAHAKMATSHQAQGNLDLAETEYQKAQWWLGLNSVPPGIEAYALDFDLSYNAEEALVALLARAQVSKDAAQALHLLTYRLLEGLNTLAANGNMDVAATLYSSLYRAVDDFNMLAYHKPELFRETARLAGGLPGILASNSTKIEQNNDLLEKLEVGHDNQLSVFRPGARARYSTPANAWAVRLVNHIVQVQEMVKCPPLSPTDVELAVSSWVPIAVNLPPLSPTTWQTWAAVGWDIIMEAARNEPEKELRLRPIGESAAKKQPKYGYEPSERTQNDNIRSKIKERIFGAFQLLATADDSPKNMETSGGNES